MIMTEVYQHKHHIRFVTASSLFDGHDASINIMRRILQASGAEVIHLGHNRSVDDVVTAALQEDVQGVAVSSYQGGHLEYFKYMIDLLRSRGGGHIKVFGGGGGVLVADVRPAAAASSSQVGPLLTYNHLTVLLRGRGAGHILESGGGAGVIVADEIPATAAEH